MRCSLARVRKKEMERAGREMATRKVMAVAKLAKGKGKSKKGAVSDGKTVFAGYCGFCGKWGLKPGIAPAMPLTRLVASLVVEVQVNEIKRKGLNKLLYFLLMMILTAANPKMIYGFWGFVLTTLMRS